MIYLRFLIITFAISLSTQVSAAIIDITAEANNGVACTTASVTGNNGGSTSCYGIFEGNDSTTDQYQIGSDIFTFLGKEESDTPDANNDIILDPLGGTSGTWAFTTDFLNNNDFGDFFLVIKASNDWGAYLFSGSDNQSISGLWQTTDSFLNKNNKAQGISHMSIYATGTSTTVPEPSILALFGLGIFGLGLSIRRKRI